MTNVKSIKFSKDYPKLHGQIAAVLLNVKTIMFNELHEDLIEYDTIATDGTKYLLPTGKLIHLTFLGDKNIPFCTIRRYTDEKYTYYQHLVHHYFVIEMTNNGEN